MRLRTPNDTCIVACSDIFKDCNDNPNPPEDMGDLYIRLVHTDLGTTDKDEQIDAYLRALMVICGFGQVGHVCQFIRAIIAKEIADKAMFNHAKAVKNALRTHTDSRLECTRIELTADEFEAQYPLIPNHLNPDDTGEDGVIFDTHGQEGDFVHSQDPRTIWTLLEDGDGNSFIASGYHYVNPIGYLVSTVPVPEDTPIEVTLK
jgi:hypothetical protein